MRRETNSRGDKEPAIYLILWTLAETAQQEFCGCARDGEIKLFWRISGMSPSDDELSQNFT